MTPPSSHVALDGSPATPEGDISAHMGNAAAINGTANVSPANGVLDIQQCFGDLSFGDGDDDTEAPQSFCCPITTVSDMFGLHSACAW